VQVLLTEEVTGSLRKLKGYPLLVRERFKSLQRRGILEPRMPTQKKTKRRRVAYEQGSRGLKEREMHAAMLAEREAKKQGLAVVSLQ
jgi:nucleolar protein 53